MTEKPPPFSALRAVEAAARHRSFTWAAKELNITHSAVSQSIRRLETELGATLFERRGGAMQPSEAAMRLAQSYAEASQALTQAIREISDDAETVGLTLGLPADLARLWLAPRLPRLAEAMPDVRLQLVTAPDPQADAVLGIAEGDEAGAESLARIELWPVCDPRFAEGRDLSTPVAILRQPLLAASPDAWAEWAREVSPQGPAPRPHLFEDARLTLDAAAEGGGVAVADQFAVAPYLESGRLTALPFAAGTPRRLVLRAGPEGRLAEAVERLGMWLKLEIRRLATLARSRRR